MTRPEAFSLARQRVQETGKPWVVATRCTGWYRCGDVHCAAAPHEYDAATTYGEIPHGWGMAAWLSVNGSVQVYDGLGVPEGMR